MKSLYTIFLSACLATAVCASPYDPLAEAEQTIYELVQEQNRLHAVIADLNYQLQQAQHAAYNLEQSAVDGAYANNDLYNDNVSLGLEVERLNNIIIGLENEIAHLRAELIAHGYSADIAVDNLAHELDQTRVNYDDLYYRYNTLCFDHEEQSNKLSQAKREIEDLESVIIIKNRHLKNGGIAVEEYDNLYKNNKELAKTIRGHIENEKKLRDQAATNFGVGLLVGGILGVAWTVVLTQIANS